MLTYLLTVWMTYTVAAGTSYGGPAKHESMHQLETTTLEKCEFAGRRANAMKSANASVRWECKQTPEVSTGG